MYFRMILFSYTCTVSILQFIVAVQADTKQTLRSNEVSLSLSNEQITEYNYEKTIQSAETENNQDHSITTNINTEFVQKIHSSNELDLNIADSTDLNSALNMDKMSELNMLSNNEASITNDYGTKSTLEISNTEVKKGDTAFMSQNGLKDSKNYNTPTNPNGELLDRLNGQAYDSNGNKLSDTSFINSYQSSNYYGFNLQNIGEVNGEIPTTATSSPGSNETPSIAILTSRNENLNSDSNDAVKVNNVLSQLNTPLTYPIEVPINMNTGVPNYPQTSSPNSGNGAPNGNLNGGTPSTATSTTNSNGSPSSSSPSSPNGDATGKPNGQDYDSNGNKISDTSFLNSYKSSSYFGYSLQNIADVSGELPTSATSSPGSNGFPSSVTTTTPNGNLNSAPNSNQNAATPSTTTLTTNSNGSPSNSSPSSTNGDTTGKPNGQDYDSNGNKISDTSFLNSYKSSSYFGYSLQNIADVNGEILTTATSSTGSNGSPSSATTTTPNGNLNSAPNSNQNAATPSTTTSTTNSNGSPSSSSPSSPNGDTTGKPNGQDYDSNGNKISDTSFLNSYKSSSYFGYSLQNIADVSGEIPTTATSSPGSNGSPSSVITSTPNGNSKSAPNSNQNAATPSTTTSTTNSNGSPSNSSPSSPNGDTTGKPNVQEYDSNGNKISDTSFLNSYKSSSFFGYSLQNIADVNGEIPTTATSSPGSNGSPSSVITSTPNGNSKSAPNSNQNAATPSTTTSTTNSNGSPSNSFPSSPNGDTTGKPNVQEYDSNGNKISDTSFLNSYKSSSFFGYSLQNIADVNGEIPTTETSSPGSNGSPSSVITSTPNGNSNIAPISNQNAATPSTTTSTTNSNGSPSNSSPSSPNGDTTGKPNVQEYDSNGNKISDTSFLNSYKSSSFFGYSLQNIADVNGEIPTTATSSPSSNGSPSSVITSTPNGNSKSAPNSNQNTATPSTTTSTTNSNGSPSNSSPSSPNGDTTGKPNVQEYDSNGNKISDTSFLNSYKSSSFFGYSLQNIADVNGEIPTTATSSPGSNGSPSSVITSTPNGNSKSAPNSNQNAATPSTTTSTTNSNGSPSNSSPSSPNGDTTGKPNVQEYDSNGNKISDTSFLNSYKSSSFFGYSLQNIADVNGEIPTTETSSPGSNGSPSSVITSTPNGNSNIAPISNQNAATPSTTTSTTNSNGSPSNSSPSSPNGDTTGKPNVQEYDSNGNKISDTSFLNSYKSSSFFGYSLQNIADVNGEIPTTATSSPSSNGSPSSVITSTPNGNSKSAPNSNQNAATPSTTTSTTKSNGSPSSLTYPYGDLMNKPNVQVYDSNGNKLSDNRFMNSYQSSNYYGYNQNTEDQDTSFNYPPETSEYLNNQLLQNSVSTFNLQNSATLDQFGIIPSSPLTMPNGNSKDSLSGGGTGLSTSPDMNGSPPTVDHTPTGTEYSNLGSETYGSSNYDNDYELRNLDVVEVLNDGQLNMDDRYISHNYDDANNNGFNIPLLNENEDVYNNYFYADNSVNMVPSLDGNFNTQNDDNYVDGYFENVPFDNGNMQEPSYEPYAPNLNARYENSQQQYRLNQNAPPFRGYPFMGNDIAPFDTNIYPDNYPQMSVINSDLYNYNNIDGIEYDQTKIGIDETNSENNQLSMRDLNTFSSTQISQTTDNFRDTDLASDNMVYDFVDVDNRDLETIDSNYIGQVNENNVYNGQGFIGYNNMQSINVPEYNQFNGDYTTTYLSNLGAFETSSSNTGTDIAVDGPEGPYLTPQLLNSNSNLLTRSNLNKQSSDLNSLLVDNVQLNSKTGTSNVNTQVEDSATDNSNDSPLNSVDNRFKFIQTTVLSKNNELDVGQYVYGANGQVLGKIYKPSGIAKTKNRHKYSGSSSYSSPNDSEFSDDMHAIGHDIKRAARDAIGNVHDKIKDAYDTTKAVGKAVRDIAGNAASKAADGIEETAKTAYQGSKDAVKGVGNAVGEVADDVEDIAKTTYQGSKDAVKSVGNAVGEVADDVGETAKTAYQDSKDAVKGVGNAVGKVADDVGETAKTAYQGTKDAAKSVGNAVGEVADDVGETAKTAYQGTKDAAKSVGNAVGEVADDVGETAKTAYQGTKDAAKSVGNAVGEVADGVGETAKTAYQGSKDAAKSVGNAVGEVADDVGQTAKAAYQGSKAAVNGIENAISDAADAEETTEIFLN